MKRILFTEVANTAACLVYMHYGLKLAAFVKGLTFSRIGIFLKLVFFIALIAILNVKAFVITKF